MAATEITPPQPQSEFTKISSQSETATENNEASKYDLTALVAAINITDEMDLTSTTVDLTGVDEDLKAFQEDPLVKAALDKNVNLGEYSKKIENDLIGIEMDSMNDYLDAAEDVADLYGQIQNCDSLLERMQEMLFGFQEHLAAISGEIRDLQDQSRQMNRELTNKKAANKHLSRAVSELCVGEDIMSAIQNNPVNKDFVQPLTELNAKIEYHGNLDTRTYRVARDMEPVLQNLRERVVGRLRGFLVRQFEELCTPGTNLQMRQQVILDYKYFQTFLAQHAPDVASELRHVYVDLMTRVYNSHFRKYIQNLSRHRDNTKVADRNDLLGADVERSVGFFGSRKSVEHMNFLFNLGVRYQVIENFEENALVVHHLDPNVRFPYEVIFKSLLRILGDAAVSEYKFLMRFFGKKDMFDDIFRPVIHMYMEEFDSFRTSCFDSICLFLMIRLVDKQYRSMVERKVPCLDKFFHELNMLLWPRLKIVFDENVLSLKNCTPNPRGKARSAATDSEKNEVSPHFTTTRFATFVTAFLVLNREQDEDYIKAVVRTAREEYEKLLLRLSQVIEDEARRSVFMINNYAVIVSTMKFHHIHPGDDELSAFQASMDAHIAEHVGILLNVYLGRWLHFISSTEAKLEDNPRSQIDLSLLETRISHFATNWQTITDNLTRDIGVNFAPNVPAAMAEELGAEYLFQTSNDVLKNAYAELVSYYHRLKDLVRKIAQNQAVSSSIQTALVTTEKNLMYKARDVLRGNV